jgi:hypothetical protein
MSTAGQLPDGVTVSVVDLHEYSRAPSRWMKTVRQGGYVAVINGRVGHVAPVGFITPDCPPELAGTLPGMLSEIAESKHRVASEAARQRRRRQRDRASA